MRSQGKKNNTASTAYKHISLLEVLVVLVVIWLASIALRRGIDETQRPSKYNSLWSKLRRLQLLRNNDDEL